LARVIITRFYVVSSQTSAIAEFLTRLDMLASQLYPAAQVVNVKTAWSEVDWTLGANEASICVRADEDTHDALAREYTVGAA
jgi:hypothetical protein